MLSIDLPRVTSDEACELVVYHLRLAAAYFEATPHDQCKQLLDELMRQRRACEPGPWPWWAPSVDFIKQLHREYEEMEKS